jgi:hypothetical protein
VSPKRIQRQRTKGWRMPANTVYVGRPSILGNPFSAENAMEVGYLRRDAMPWEVGAFLTACFRDWLTERPGVDWWQGAESEWRKAQIKVALPDLRGKYLACWCSLDRPCHADVLLELANARQP